MALAYTILLSFNIRHKELKCFPYSCSHLKTSHLKTHDFEHKAWAIPKSNKFVYIKRFNCHFSSSTHATHHVSCTQLDHSKTYSYELPVYTVYTLDLLPYRLSYLTSLIFSYLLFVYINQANIHTQIWLCALCFNHHYHFFPDLDEEVGHSPQ